MEKYEDIILGFGDSRSNATAMVKPYKPEHAPAMKQVFYKKALHHMELVLEEGQDAFDAYVEYLNDISLSGKVFSFSCFDTEGVFAGITQLKYLDFFNKKCEMGGTWYGEKYHGTGFNKAVKALVFQYVFEGMGFKRLQFSIDVNNIASIKSMAKIGAQKEGHFRNNWVDSHGQSRDDYYFSITAEDWETLRTTLYKEYI